MDKECPACIGVEEIMSHGYCDKHDTCVGCGINRKNLPDSEDIWMAMYGSFRCDACLVKDTKDEIKEIDCSRGITVDCPASKNDEDGEFKIHSLQHPIEGEDYDEGSGILAPSPGSHHTIIKVTTEGCEIISIQNKDE